MIGIRKKSIDILINGDNSQSQKSEAEFKSRIQKQNSAAGASIYLSRFLLSVQAEMTTGCVFISALD
jgi:hypothetical protein